MKISEEQARLVFSAENFNNAACLSLLVPLAVSIPFWGAAAVTDSFVFNSILALVGISTLGACITLFSKASKKRQKLKALYEEFLKFSPVELSSDEFSSMLKTVSKGEVFQLKRNEYTDYGMVEKDYVFAWVNDELKVMTAASSVWVEEKKLPELFPMSNEVEDLVPTKAVIEKSAEPVYQTMN